MSSGTAHHNQDSARSSKPDAARTPLSVAAEMEATLDAQSCAILRPPLCSCTTAVAENDRPTSPDRAETRILSPVNRRTLASIP
jgi:hypothetical protein